MVICSTVQFCRFSATKGSRARGLPNVVRTYQYNVREEEIHFTVCRGGLAVLAHMLPPLLPGRAGLGLYRMETAYFAFKRCSPRRRRRPRSRREEERALQISVLGRGAASKAQGPGRRGIHKISHLDPFDKQVSQPASVYTYLLRTQREPYPCARALTTWSEVDT